jgi:hypothetical protein
MNRPIKIRTTYFAGAHQDAISSFDSLSYQNLRAPSARTSCTRTGGNTQHLNTRVRRFATGPSTLHPPKLEGKIFPISFKRCLAEEASRRVRPTGIAIIEPETRLALSGSNLVGALIWYHMRAPASRESGWRCRARARANLRNLERIVRSETSEQELPR